MSNVTADQVLDALGLRCPLPVLKARKALSALSAGQLLEVLTDDPAAPEDFAALCQMTGHRLIAHNQDGGGHRFLIVSAGPPVEQGR
jgi:tRNA 2-thiouridine synthesizing protein A